MKAFYMRTHVHSRIVTYDTQYYRRKYWMSFQGDEEHEKWGVSTVFENEAKYRDSIHRSTYVTNKSGF